MFQPSQKKDNAVILPVEGNLALGLESQLKDGLLKEISLCTGPMLLDFSKVSFIDSACLGVLIGVVKKIRQKGQDLFIFGLQDEVRSIFQITRLDKVIRVFKTVDEALVVCRS